MLAGKHMLNRIGGMTMVAGLALAWGGLLNGCAMTPTHEEVTDTYHNMVREIARAYQKWVRTCYEQSGDDRNACMRAANAWHTKALAVANRAYSEAQSNRFRAAQSQRQVVRDLLKQALEKLPAFDRETIKQIEELIDQQSTVVELDIEATPESSDPSVVDILAGSSQGVQLRGASRYLAPSRTYHLSRGGVVSSPRISGSFEVDGWMTVSMQDQDPSAGVRYGVRGVSVRITTAGGGMSLTSETWWGSNRLDLNAEGVGTLHLATRAKYDDPVAGYMLPAMMALELPVQVEGSVLRIRTGAEGAPLYRLSPLIDFPVSDYNDDGSVDLADQGAFLADWAAGTGGLTDLDGDGDRDLEDLSLFDEFFQFDLNRPR